MVKGVKKYTFPIIKLSRSNVMYSLVTTVNDVVA